jgi:hypothetical protein
LRPKAFTFGNQRSDVVKQPHTEETIKHTEDEQNTGNHKKPGAADAGGADRVGGTRAGAENVEPKAKNKKPA